MKKFEGLKYLFLLSLLFGLFSCGKSANVMVFKDNIRYINDFPEKYSFENPEAVESGVIGMLDFTIADSLMVVYTMDKKRAWSILSLGDMSVLGKFIIRGRGPEEFLSIPWPSQCEFFYDDEGDMCVYLDDPDKRRLCKMNVSRSLSDGQICLEVLGENLPYPSLRIAYINDSTIFYKMVSNDELRHERCLLVNGRSVITQRLAELNSAHVNSGNNHYLMYSFINYARHKDLLVEVPIRLMDINIYSPDGSRAMSLCMEEQPTDLDRLQRLDRGNDVSENFFGMRLYRDFFVVLYIGETSWSRKIGYQNTPHLYFFDYEGNPLIDASLDRHVTSFDIDFGSKKLYIFDLDTEKMWKYDMSDMHLSSPELLTGKN